MFVLDMSKELRGSRLVNDYCNEEDIKSNNSWIEGLKQCISLKKGGLAKRLGGFEVGEPHASRSTIGHQLGEVGDPGCLELLRRAGGPILPPKGKGDGPDPAPGRSPRAPSALAF